MDEERILDKIDRLDQYLNEFRSGMPENLQEYRAERRKFERLFQLCIETVIDLNALIVKEEGLGTPSDEDSLVRKVQEEGIIGPELSQKILEMKGFRNVLVHRYGEIDDERAFSNLDRLEDLDRFRQEVLEYLE